MKTIHNAFLCLMLVALFASGCTKDPHEAVSAEQLYVMAEEQRVAGNEDEALRLYSQAALKDAGKAQLMLAEYYRFGQLHPAGLDRYYAGAQEMGAHWDPDRAATWSDKAAATLQREAEEGSTEAMYLLGRNYHTQYNRDRDRAQAVYWWKKAAAAGHPEAKLALALSQYGDGRDDAARLETIKAAAEAGHPGAIALLADLYANGNGIEPDFEQHVFWLRKAAGQDMFILLRDEAERELRILENQGLID